MKPLVGIIMGSNSDLEVMMGAAYFLAAIDVQHEIQTVSAHRNPVLMYDYASTAEGRGLKVIIAGAGGAAHLPGMTAALTMLPVIGVPIKSSNSLDGWDSILSILQMPTGTPVATVGLNASHNAAILAARILALNDPVLANKLRKKLNTSGK